MVHHAVIPGMLIISKNAFLDLWQTTKNYFCSSQSKELACHFTHLILKSYYDKSPQLRHSVNSI